jgi:hypothetical protein
MKMRDEHMQAFTEAAVKDFEDRMVVHLNEFFPEQCEALGEAKTREAIREGIDRAARYEIVAECDVCKYIDLMFAFGRNFDTDPKLPWAGEVLNAPAIDDPTARINVLYDAAREYLRRLARISDKGGQ